MSQGDDDNRKSAPPGGFGFPHASPFGPGAKPVAAGGQHPSMDRSENNRYEWSDWFTKARPVSTEQESPSPDGPGRARPAFGREQTLAEAALDGLVPGSMLTASQQAPSTEDAPTAPAAMEQPVAETPTVEPPAVERADSAPIQADPIRRTRYEADPVEADPVEAGPGEAGPVDAAPVQPDAVETAPVEAAPAEATPILADPVEGAPSKPRRFRQTPWRPARRLSPPR